MHILFANTGVQVICVPLTSGRRYNMAQIGYGWQLCHCLNPERPEEIEEGDEDKYPPVLVPYVLWQIVQSHVSKLYLAIDTSLGDPDVGYFADPATLAGFFELHVEQGPRLEHAGVTIGVVRAIAGRRAQRVIIHGRSDHAGTTPMALRAGP